MIDKQKERSLRFYFVSSRSRIYTLNFINLKLVLLEIARCCLKGVIVSFRGRQERKNVRKNFSLIGRHNEGNDFIANHELRKHLSPSCEKCFVKDHERPAPLFRLVQSNLHVRTIASIRMDHFWFFKEIPRRTKNIIYVSPSCLNNCMTLLERNADRI